MFKHTFSYDCKALKALRLFAHVSLIKNGTIDDVEKESKSRWSAAADIHDVQFQFRHNILWKIIDALKEWRGDIFCPIWNVDYEREIVDNSMKAIASEYRRYLRFVEMRDVSALAYQLFDLSTPDRDSGKAWRSLESLRWYIDRAREIFK